MQYKHIPLEFKQLNQWATWFKTEDGTKVLKGKSNDSSTWSDFATAVNKCSDNEHLAFIFQKSNRFIFIDLDDCTGEIATSSFAEEIMQNIPSYTQKSFSNEGLHIFCKAYDGMDLTPFSMGKRVIDGNSLEIYSDVRYCAMTGNLFGNNKNITVINKDQEKYLLELMSKFRGNNNNKEKKEVNSIPSKITNKDILVIKEALSHINIVTEDEWFNGVTRSIASVVSGQPEFEPELKQIWDDWSQTQDGYNEIENNKRWDRAVSDTNKVSLGTLFHLAKKGGYKTPIEKFIEKKKYCVDVNTGEKTEETDDTLIPVPFVPKSAWDISQTISPDYANKNNFIASNLIPKGATIIASDPKVGKSCFSTQLATSFISGLKLMDTFDIPFKGKVLLFANEEHSSAIIDRLKNQGVTSKEILENLIIHDITCEKIMLDDEGLKRINDIYIKPLGIKFVIVDIWDNMRPYISERNMNAYTVEYKQASPLKNYVASKINTPEEVSFIVMHHTNKDGKNKNNFSRVSGTQAMRGAWDTCIVIKEEDKNTGMYSMEIETRVANCRHITEDRVLVKKTPEYKYAYEGLYSIKFRNQVSNNIVNIFLSSKESVLTTAEISGGLEAHFNKVLSPSLLSYHLKRMVGDGVLAKTTRRGEYEYRPKSEYKGAQAIDTDMENTMFDSNEDLFGNN